ncbi:hypothetical protein BKA62DRAFT_684336 [Auriculariales sp. MPI-PUGE-AT-0066]|nr:hypothetical protein BKA62DRAFT_684336 [Auriculariales sp. MPI-PUGE-AT-0066]
MMAEFMPVDVPMADFGMDGVDATLPDTQMEDWPEQRDDEMADAHLHDTADDEMTDDGFIAQPIDDFEVPDYHLADATQVMDPAIQLPFTVPDSFYASDPALPQSVTHSDITLPATSAVIPHLEPVSYPSAEDQAASVSPIQTSAHGNLDAHEVHEEYTLTDHEHNEETTHVDPASRSALTASHADADYSGAAVDGHASALESTDVAPEPLTAEDEAEHALPVENLRANELVAAYGSDQPVELLESYTAPPADEEIEDPSIGGTASGVLGHHEHDTIPAFISPPPVGLSISNVPDRHYTMFGLQEIVTATDLPEYTTFVFADRPELFTESLAVVFDAIRSSLPGEQFDIFTELILYSKDLDLTIPEDNRLVQDISLQSLDTLRNEFEFKRANPHQLELRLGQEPRLIERFNYLSEKASEMRIQRESGPGGQQTMPPQVTTAEEEQEQSPAQGVAEQIGEEYDATEVSTRLPDVSDNSPQRPAAELDHRLDVNDGEVQDASAEASPDDLAVDDENVVGEALDDPEAEEEWGDAAEGEIHNDEPQELEISVAEPFELFDEESEFGEVDSEFIDELPNFIEEDHPADESAFESHAGVADDAEGTEYDEHTEQQHPDHTDESVAVAEHSEADHSEVHEHDLSAADPLDDPEEDVHGCDHSTDTAVPVESGATSEQLQELEADDLAHDSVNFGQDEEDDFQNGEDDGTDDDQATISSGEPEANALPVTAPPPRMSPTTSKRSHNDFLRENSGLDHLSDQDDDHADSKRARTE